MLYISLPVHTQPGVLIGQLRNFASFAPAATVVLHVSRQARFELAQLERLLGTAACHNVLINQERLPTSWGNILPAHVSNCRFIRQRADASRICLHSSNDMLVRHGMDAWSAARPNLLNYRPVRPGTNWRFGQPALDDVALGVVRERLGGVEVVASQIEGSCYEAALLFEVADIVAGAPSLAPRVAYPREEVWLSTIAHGLGATVHGCPYVFSEFHRFDRVFWAVLRYLDPVLGKRNPAAPFIRRCVEYAMIKTGFHRISTGLVERIVRGDWQWLARYQYLSDGNATWRVFEPQGLFGVKRVPRRLNSPLRRYIDALAQAPDWPLQGEGARR